MLANYVRNKESFKSLAKTIKSFRTIDLYNEFNKLGEYFNITLKNELENILNISLVTEPNKFLINIGDGNISWVDIIDIIDDNSIILNKLQKIPNKSILCSNDLGIIVPISCNMDYGILFGRYQNTHIWRKLINEDIDNQSISGDKINKLEQINIDDSLTDNFLEPNILQSHNISDDCIYSDKIKNNEFNTSLIATAYTGFVRDGFIPEKYENEIGVNNLDAFNSNILTPDKILDESIDFLTNPQIFVLREYSDNPLYLHNYKDLIYEFPINYNLPNAEIIESYNIKAECLDDDHLIPYEDIGDWNNIPWHDNPLEPRYFQQGYIHPRDDCRVEGRCIPHGNLRLRHFDDEVRNAMIAKGVTDND